MTAQRDRRLDPAFPHPSWSELMGRQRLPKFANAKSELLLTVLNLPFGIPQKDISRRVLAMLKPDDFQACFTLRITAMCARAGQISDLADDTVPPRHRTHIVVPITQ